jgi:AcrR family transcriptional regulator
MVAVRHPESILAESARQRILRAAARLYASRGFAGTSIREIALAAGVKKPLVFYHFESKEHLYRTLFLEAIQVAHENALRVLREAPDVRACLKGLLGSMIDLARSYPEVYAFVHEVMTMPGQIPLGFDYRAEGERLINILESVAERGKAEGVLRDLPTDLIIMLPLGILGISVAGVLSGSREALPEDFGETLYDLMSRGVEVRGA